MSVQLRFSIFQVSWEIPFKFPNNSLTIIVVLLHVFSKFNLTLLIGLMKDFKCIYFSMMKGIEYNERSMKYDRERREIRV